MSELFRIKPLTWIEGHDHIIARTSFGTWYKVQSGKQCRFSEKSISSSAYDIPCDSIEAGRAICEERWRARLMEYLEPVHATDLGELNLKLEDCKKSNA